MLKLIKEHKFFFILTSVFTLIIGVFFMLTPITIHGDYFFQLNRLKSVENIIYSPLNFLTYANQGKAVNIFYPSYTISMINLFNIIIRNNYWSFKVFMIFIIFLTTNTMYFSSYSITKNKKVSIISSFMYTFSTYSLLNIFVRLALGEVMSYVFMPILFLGVHKLFFTDDVKKWWITPIALGLIIQSHLISFMIAIFFVIISFFISLICKNNLMHKVKYFIYCLITTLLLSIVSVVPLIEQLKANQIHTTDLTHVFNNYAHSINNYFIEFLKFDFFDLNFGILIFALILFWVAKFKSIKLADRLWLLVVLFLVIIQIKSPILSLLQTTFLKNLQFTYRFNSWTILIVCFIVPQIYKKQINNKCNLNIILFTQSLVILINFFVLTFAHTSTNQRIKINNENELSQKVYTKSHYDYINQQQYKKFNYKLIENKKVYLNSKIIRPNIFYTQNQMIIKFNTTPNNDQLILPITLYKGLIATDNNKNVELKVSKFGSVSIKLIKSRFHTVIINCKWTLIAQISQLTMIFTYLFIVIYIWKNQKKIQ